MRFFSIAILKKKSLSIETCLLERILKELYSVKTHTRVNELNFTKICVVYIGSHEMAQNKPFEAILKLKWTLHCMLKIRYSPLLSTHTKINIFCRQHSCFFCCFIISLLFLCVNYFLSRYGLNIWLSSLYGMTQLKDKSTNTNIFEKKQTNATRILASNKHVITNESLLRIS
jgi:hypothetical protein